MKSTRLFFSALLASTVMLISCNNEETTTQATTTTFEFAKTTEMLNFESSLKNWFQAKRETEKGQMSAKTNADLERKVTEDSKKLLLVLGEDELATKQNQTTEELIRTTMKAYSKKLSKIYQQSKK